MAPVISHALLAQALLQCVRAQNFAEVQDSQVGGKRIPHFPSLDLAVVAFPVGAAPVWANVLFSREFPDGVIADTGPQAHAITHVQYLQDQTNAAGDSIAWSPDSDWSRMAWVPLNTPSAAACRFVSPYPASLIKLMVALGVGRVVDGGYTHWDSLWTYGGVQKSVSAWTESMVVASNNDATSAMVALLHTAGLIVSNASGETNHLNRWFDSLGLSTLRLSDTRPDGGWRNGDGAGVGHLHMTAWDTVRLLWLVDEPGAASAVPPWRTNASVPILLPESRRRIWGFLQDQGLHEILSSTVLAGVPGWQAGLAAHVPMRWLQADGSAQVEDAMFPADIRACNAQSRVQFAHKTGTTDNYASDAGRVTPLQGAGGHYLIALTSNLGRRYAPHPDCATDWRIPRLGASIDQWLQARLD